MADFLNPQGLTAHALSWIFSTNPWVPTMLAGTATAFWGWLAFPFVHSEKAAISPVSLKTRSQASTEVATAKQLRTSDRSDNRAFSSHVDAYCFLLKAFELEARTRLQAGIRELETAKKGVPSDRVSEWKIAHNRRMESEFNVRFRADAIKYRDALSKETGIPINGVDDPTVELLVHGKLSDGASILSLVTFLKSMSRRLPP